MDTIGERRLHRDRSGAICWYPPRRIVARLLAALRPAKAHKIPEETQNNVISLSTSRSMSVLNGHEEPGLCKDNTSFKLGVSCGLLYLIAASKNELAKMVELREGMEKLLQNVREELQRKDALLEPSKLSDTLASSITDIQEVSSSNSHPSAQSQKPYVQPESKSKMVHNHFLHYIISEQDECVEKINELEAELAVELEMLQLHFDGETTLQHTQDGSIKFLVFGTIPEWLKSQNVNWQVTIEESSPSSDGTNFDEIIDPQEASTELCFGVPPVELERRLHELLEARQEERIAELESALECARQKLIQKEVEITWWKDTARLISLHVPETSRFTFQLDPETALKLK
ncbi:hypothetical protein L6164_015687 [Bauhinia variegata]|uniref:Uncharacterized protein n=1 Tax=Bauhinia variegata TaxID=167791 RepID=A0ACB9NQ39_BAUVA|nr:hypothetical protein L6164_015687 [Bauhinia variegata]